MASPVVFDTLKHFDDAVARRLWGLVIPDPDNSSKQFQVPVFVETVESEWDLLKKQLEENRPMPIIVVVRRSVVFDDDRTESQTEFQDLDSAETVDVQVGRGTHRYIHDMSDLEPNPITVPIYRNRWDGLSQPFNIYYTMAIFSRKKDPQRACELRVQSRFLRHRPLQVWSSYAQNSSDPANGATLLGEFDIYTCPEGVFGRLPSRDIPENITGGLLRREMDFVVEGILDLVEEDPTKIWTVRSRHIEIQQGSDPDTSAADVVLQPDTEV